MSRSGRKKKRMMRRMERWVEEYSKQNPGQGYHFLGVDFAQLEQKLYFAMGDYVDTAPPTPSLKHLAKKQSIKDEIWQKLYGGIGDYPTFPSSPPKKFLGIDVVVPETGSFPGIKVIGPKPGP